MKYLIGIFMLLLIETASAAQCRVNGGPWTWIDQWAGRQMSVSATVRRIPGTSMVRLDGYTLECRLEAGGGNTPRERDIWMTYGGHMSVGPKLSGRQVGATINGTDYNSPLMSLMHIATAVRGGPGVNLNTYGYAMQAAGVNFVAGDPLLTIALSIDRNYGSGNLSDVRFHLHAANNLPPDISTCTINNNRTIDVNFNTVNSALIGEGVSTTPIKKDIQLNYSCPQGGMTMPITIGFRGQAASFNSGALAMNNSNLATALLRGGVQVRPGQAFTTNLSNSSGRDTVTFALIRRPGSTPATGAFSGSATLVMGVP